MAAGGRCGERSLWGMVLWSPDVTRQALSSPAFSAVRGRESWTLRSKSTLIHQERVGKQRKGSWFAGFTLPLDGGVPPILVEPNLPSLFLPTGCCEPVDLGCHWWISGRERLPGGRQLYFSQAHVDGRWDARVPGYVLSPNPQPGLAQHPLGGVWGAALAALPLGFPALSLST